MIYEAGLKAGLTGIWYWIHKEAPIGQIISSTLLLLLKTMERLSIYRLCSSTWATSPNSCPRAPCGLETQSMGIQVLNQLPSSEKMGRLWPSCRISRTPLMITALWWERRKCGSRWSRTASTPSSSSLDLQSGIRYSSMSVMKYLHTLSVHSFSRWAGFRHFKYKWRVRDVFSRL